MTKPKPQPLARHDDAKELRRFNKAARQLGCEPDEKRFQDALRTVAKVKPQPLPPKKSKRA